MSETVKTQIGVDGFIAWCIICQNRIVRKGHEETTGITECYKGENFLGYGHTACANTLQPEKA